MSPLKKHPHLDCASEGDLAAVVELRTPELRELYLRAHGLVLDSLPGVKYSTDTVDATTGYGARQYGYNGWGVAALMVHARWISIAFFRGASLPDPDGILEGTGIRVRHVKVHSLEELRRRRDAIVELLHQATTGDTSGVR